MKNHKIQNKHYNTMAWIEAEGRNLSIDIEAYDDFSEEGIKPEDIETIESQMVIESSSINGLGYLDSGLEPLQNPEKDQKAQICFSSGGISEILRPLMISLLLKLICASKSFFVFCKDSRLASRYSSPFIELDSLYGIQMVSVPSLLKSSYASIRLMN